MTGRVLTIEKTSIHDGQGLRTVVFLKGCSMRCKWCSTPESQSYQIEHGYGMDMTVEDVVKEVSKDEIFFFHSGGGVTLSGGEVLEQADFAREILKECLIRGIHTAIETNFFSEYQEIEKLLPYLNALYVDIKLMDEEAHRAWTGVSNKKILENILLLDRSSYPVEVHVRVPVIPTVNMSEKNLMSTLDFCRNLGKINDIELLPYHRLGIDTYKKIGKKYELKEIQPPSKETLYSLAESMAARAKGLRIIAEGRVFLNY